MRAISVMSAAVHGMKRPGLGAHIRIQSETRPLQGARTGESQQTAGALHTSRSPHQTHERVRRAGDMVRWQREGTLSAAG